MKTAMQELIDELKDYKRTTLRDKLEITFWIVKAENLLKKEKGQIIDAVDYGTKHFGELGEKYYTKTYNQNK